LQKVESLVNERILQNHPLVEHRTISMKEAEANGAMMLFGEKYGEEVRMIEFGSSKELCGGTHSPATGSLGTFRITSESAVASGIRRIEAITGAAALEAAQSERATIDQVKELLKAPKDIAKAIGDLLSKQNALLKEQEAHKAQAAQAAKKELASNLEQINGVNTFIGELPLDTSAIKDIAFQLKAEKAPFFGVFASRAGGKPTISVAISDDIVKERDLNAGAIIRNIASHIKGGGGGQPFFATAGGKEESGIPAALQAAREIL
jgi:alanyl-tRNA synthetase